MVTKEQLESLCMLSNGTLKPNTRFKDLHTGMVYRPNGKVKAWKSAKNSHRFRLPVKHGLYVYSAIDENNAAAWEVVHDG